MKVHLMHRDRDFDPSQAPPINESDLIQDLALPTLLAAMAQGDPFFRKVAQRALLSGLRAEPDSILYRQAVLRDCLRHETVVRRIHEIAVEAIESKRRQWLGIYGRYPGSILHGAADLLRLLVDRLTELRRLAGVHANAFESEGFRAFFEEIRTGLTDVYLADIKARLKDLEFPRGVLVSARLGSGNQGTDYVLHRMTAPGPRWVPRILRRRPPAFSFRIDARDEAGARAVAALRDRSINSVANALAQSADHVLGFFVQLRTELAFHLGAVNLHHQLARIGLPLSFPEPRSPGSCELACRDLADASLGLSLGRPVVGNDLDADRKKLVVITGANRGGKSTFLRALGLAQLMMQGGMFVTAQSFRADVCRAIFTHYRREEDASMQSGKLDEELGRMSGIVDALTPHSLLLLNESFAATNEREGSEIARQIVRTLLGHPVKILFVTHLYEFARHHWEQDEDGALFLRAERGPDGQRTFKLRPGEPLQTSYGTDLYDSIFAKEEPDTRT